MCDHGTPSDHAAGAANQAKYSQSGGVNMFYGTGSNCFEDGNEKMESCQS